MIDAMKYVVYRTRNTTRYTREGHESTSKRDNIESFDTEDAAKLAVLLYTLRSDVERIRRPPGTLMAELMDQTYYTYAPESAAS